MLSTLNDNGKLPLPCFCDFEQQRNHLSCPFDFIKWILKQKTQDFTSGSHRPEIVDMGATLGGDDPSVEKFNE